MEKPQVIQLYQHCNSFLTDSFDDIMIRLMRKCQGKQVTSVLLCGSDPGVGTTTATIDLAIALAQSQRKTLLIDSDVRKKQGHKHLSKHQMPGLADFLEQTASLEEVLYETNYAGLHYIPSGSAEDHSLRLLGSVALGKMLELLGEQFDFILLDSPSLEAANDAVALSLAVDAILLVAVPGLSNRSNLVKAKQVLNGDGDKVLGVIVNKVSPSAYRAYMKHYDYFTKEKYLLRATNKKESDQ